MNLACMGVKTLIRCAYCVNSRNVFRKIIFEYIFNICQSRPRVARDEDFYNFGKTLVNGHDVDNPIN